MINNRRFLAITALGMAAATIGPDNSPVRLRLPRDDWRDPKVEPQYKTFPAKKKNRALRRIKGR